MKTFILIIITSINLFSADFYPLHLGKERVINFYNPDGSIAGTIISTIIDTLSIHNLNGYIQSEAGESLRPRRK